MKRFAFTLEKVSRYREARLRAEEARYATLRAYFDSLQDRMRDLEDSHLGRRVALSRGLQADGAQLERLHQYGEFVSVEVTRLARERDALKRDLETQAAVLTECRRNVELLEKLRDKEMKTWDQESTKELQLAAEESYNARWLRDRRCY
jgi:flagellar export protein FliJ